MNAPDPTAAAPTPRDIPRRAAPPRPTPRPTPRVERSPRASRRELLATRNDVISAALLLQAFEIGAELRPTDDEVETARAEIQQTFDNAVLNYAKELIR